jgi:hypothetical protein
MSLRLGDRAVSALLFAVALGLGCGGGEPVADAPSEAASVIAEGFADVSPWVRAETIRLVSAARLDAYQPQVRAALEDESALVRTSAVEAMLRWQDAGAEEAALAGLVTGSSAQRVELLGLIVQNTGGRFRAEALQRSLRDSDTGVRTAALDHLERLRIAPPRGDLERMVDSEDVALQERAFAELARVDEGAAMTRVLGDLRASDADRVARGLRLAKHLPLAELWRPMRSYAMHGSTSERASALVVLGHLGDPWAEAGLRQLMLGSTDAAAAEALVALAHIPTESAARKALAHRSEAREAVRRAALEAMQIQRRPAQEFEVFLSDANPEIGQLAFLHLEGLDPSFAAASFARSLDEATDAVNVVRALYAASQNRDATALLRASEARLSTLQFHADSDVSDLATRLLLKVRPVQDVLSMIDEQTQPGALYAALESAASSGSAEWSGLFEQALGADYFALRLAAAVGVLQLGAQYTPSAAADAAS